MKKFLKWTVIIFGGLIGFLAIAVFGLYQFGMSRINQAPSVAARPVAARTGEAALARGKHLVNSVATCASCHGPNLEGQTFLDDPMLGYMAAPNLTSGAGGVGASYTLEDWELAIRHGIGGDGRALGIMPSNYYAHLTDDDLASMVGYITSLPPVDNVLPETVLSVPAVIIFAVFDYQNLPVNLIDHASVGSSFRPVGDSQDHGKYLVEIAICRDCHGPDLGGRTPQEAENGPPAGPNLTTSGNLGSWTVEQFARAMRSGQTPDGRQLDAELPMPWPYYSGMSDTEIQAIWDYLQSLPPR